MRKRKISRPHNDFIEIIHKVAQICNMSDIKYDIGIECDDVDCFIGGAHNVRIKGLRDGIPINKHILIKWHPDPVYRACFRDAYLREIDYYIDVVPALLKIQRSCNVVEGLRFKFVNCIYSSKVRDKECASVLIPFEEYQYFDRFSKMDLHHAELVVKNLAKLHALSFALSKLNSKKFEEIKNLFKMDVQYGNVNLIPKSLIYFFMSSVAIVRNETAKQELTTLAPKLQTILNKSTNPDKMYSTICHADCWNNNLVFKYKGDKPVDSLLIDFQLARYASPITDLSYFLYMSMDRSFLKENYDRLVNLYYVTLSAVLRQCNLYVEDLYPMNVFQDHLYVYSVYGLVEALVSMKIITAASEEAVKMTEMRYLKSDELCQYELENQGLYIERVNGVVNHFFERKYSLFDVLNK